MAKNKWIIYLNERSPVVPLLVISAGLALAGQFFVSQYSWTVTILGSLGILGVLVQLRLGDELKDFHKDKIIHPERPLPRGLLNPAEVESAMKGLIVFLILIAGAGSFLGHWSAGVLLAFTAIYGWLMYKEFYIGESLGRYPMAYALTHQIIIFPLYGWPAAMLGLEVLLQPVFVFFLIFNFGASMTFEICRKLDPNAHELQKTYLHHYGCGGTVVLTSAFILLSAMAGIYSGYERLLLPFQLLLLLSLSLIFFRPDRFKVIEGLATLSATVHIFVFGIGKYL